VSSGAGSRLRWVYFAPADIRTPRVDRRCIAEFCAALAARGDDVRLVAMATRLRPDEQAYDHPLAPYPVDPNAFGVEEVASPYRQGGRRRLFGAFRVLRYAAVAWREMQGRHDATVVFYTKNYGVLAALSFLRRVKPRASAIVFEAHLPRSRQRDGSPCDPPMRSWPTPMPWPPS
jgi:hypothetical protein